MKRSYIAISSQQSAQALRSVALGTLSCPQHGFVLYAAIALFPVLAEILNLVSGPLVPLSPSPLVPLYPSYILGRDEVITDVKLV
ncbi:MAG: hypothetical protein F6J93_35585 [Oscillatoria sp. SIO1A7]|nr:hypothetical protein [Oscillatoria sp. SIO1A7]